MCPFGFCYVRSLLEKDAGILLKQEKYTALFRLLLYIEEHQMDIDIRMYDRDNQTMQVVKEDKNLLSLQVQKTEIPST